MRWRRGAGALGATVALVCACATSPTGRRQLLLLPEGQVGAMGAEAFAQIKTETPRETDPATNAYVQCVADATLRAAGKPAERPRWELVVFRGEQANAFALPGGKIGVYTGLLEVARTPGQLAAVVGHEIGHVQARHGNERVSQALAVQAGAGALDALVIRDHQWRGPLMAALGLGAQVGVLLPFSRAQESEADRIGLDLMARAGFDPRDSVRLWRNMAEASGRQPPEFLSTHPAHGTRIERLREAMPRATSAWRDAVARGRRPGCRAPSAQVSLRAR